MSDDGRVDRCLTVSVLTVVWWCMLTDVRRSLCWKMSHGVFVDSCLTIFMLADIWRSLLGCQMSDAVWCVDRCLTVFIVLTAVWRLLFFLANVWWYLCWQLSDGVCFVDRYLTLYVMLTDVWWYMSDVLTDVWRYIYVVLTDVWRCMYDNSCLTVFVCMLTDVWQCLLTDYDSVCWQASDGVCMLTDVWRCLSVC